MNHHPPPPRSFGWGGGNSSSYGGVAFEIVNRKEHISFSGLEKILSLRASINWGLPDKLKVGFPNIIPVHRPLVKSPLIFDPYWLAGFVSGEGCFFFNLCKEQAQS